MMGLERIVGTEAMKEVGSGCCYLREWFYKHQNERPEWRRAYHEMVAMMYRESEGNYQKALDYMKSQGYNGMYWK